MTSCGSYKMLICDELQKLKQKLLDRSSLKERAFYQFLAGDPLTQPPEFDLTEIEQICLSVFCAGVPAKKDLSTLIEAQRKKQPISGMHYTKNLIELSAMARENVEYERNNLESYCFNHSTRDFYVLNTLFEDACSNPPRSQGAIDEIASCLYERTYPHRGWKPLLMEAIQKASDLIDFFVIEQGFLQAMDDSPTAHRTTDILIVTRILSSLVERSEHRIKRVIGIAFFIPVFSVFGVLGYFIFTNWDKTEPILAATELLGILVIISCAVFAGFKLDRIKIYNQIREAIIDWRFNRKGLDRSELKERLARLDADENE